VAILAMAPLLAANTGCPPVPPPTHFMLDVSSIGAPITNVLAFASDDLNNLTIEAEPNLAPFIRHTISFDAFISPDASIAAVGMLGTVLDHDNQLHVMAAIDDGTVHSGHFFYGMPFEELFPGFRESLLLRDMLNSSPEEAEYLRTFIESNLSIFPYTSSQNVFVQAFGELDYFSGAQNTGTISIAATVPGLIPEPIPGAAVGLGLLLIGGSVAGARRRRLRP